MLARGSSASRGSHGSATHSRALPTRCSTPNGLTSLVAPSTLQGLPGTLTPAAGLGPPRLAAGASSESSLPHAYDLASGPRPATSHSTSVGRRLPAHSAYALASSHVTPMTGRRALPSGKRP